MSAGGEEAEREADAEGLQRRAGRCGSPAARQRKLAMTLPPYDRPMRRAVLATFLCAAPLLAAPAQASHGDAWSARRCARPSARARAPRAGGVVPLPLPEPVSASAASSRSELARIASSPRPGAPAVGARTHADIAGAGRERCAAWAASPSVFDHDRACWPPRCPPARRAVGSLARRPARGLHRARPDAAGGRRPVRHGRPPRRLGRSSSRGPTTRCGAGEAPRGRRRRLEHGSCRWWTPAST